MTKFDIDPDISSASSDNCIIFPSGVLYYERDDGKRILIFPSGRASYIPDEMTTNAIKKSCE